MSKLKLNPADFVEVIKVHLNETDHPVAFANLIKSLVNSGLTEREARLQAYSIQPIELEVYYEPESGLMAVEPGACEAGTIYSPYTKELYEDPEAP